MSRLGTRLAVAGFVLAIFFAASLGCSAERRDVDQRTLAREYLNNRLYDDAISVLEKLFEADHRDSEVRLLLASALAGRVGINAIDAFDVLRESLFNKPLSKEILTEPIYEAAGSLWDGAETHQGQAAETAADPRRKAIATFEHEILKFADAMGEVAHIVEKLPHIDAKQRPKLVRGLILLREIPADSPDYVTGQVYSSILSMVQFLNFIRDAVPYSSTRFTSWTRTLYCAVNLAEFTSKISSSSYYLSYAFASLNRARRASDSATYVNLEIAEKALYNLDQVLQDHADIFDLAAIAHKLSTHAYCRP